MTDHNRGLSGDVDRRRVLAAGAATLAMGLAANTDALAQAAPAPTAQPPSAKPGRVTVERLKGGILVIGFERVEAQKPPRSGHHPRHWQGLLPARPR